MKRRLAPGSDLKGNQQNDDQDDEQEHKENIGIERPTVAKVIQRAAGLSLGFLDVVFAFQILGLCAAKGTIRIQGSERAEPEFIIRFDAARFQCRLES